MNKPDLTALIEDLQNAKEGSRELSDRCLRAVGYTQERRIASFNVDKYFDAWLSPEGKYIGNPPTPARSVDDALDCMVPEGWHLEEMHTTDPDRALQPHLCSANLTPDMNNFADGQGPKRADARTLALAVVTARIKLELDKCDG